MKNKSTRKSIIPIAAIAILVAIGGAAGSIAFVTNADEIANVVKPAICEDHEAMRTAVEDGNYTAWEELMNKKVAELESKINEDTFRVLQEAHELMQNGDREAVRKIMQDLGMPHGPKGPRGGGMHR